MHLTQFLTQNQLVYSMQRLILLFISPGASPSSVTLRSCAPIRLIISPSRAVLPLILTLFCHLFASSSFFFLASSSWEILDVSSASSVACAHAHTEWKESQGCSSSGSLCSFFFIGTRVWTGMLRVQNVCTRGEKCTCKNDEMTHSVS